MRIGIRGWVSVYSLLAQLSACVALSQETSTTPDSILLIQYLRAISVSASPILIPSDSGSIEFRLVITEAEIYSSVIAECIEFTGTEGSEVHLRYSLRLEPSRFTGRSKPEFEGMDITIVRWESPRKVVCKVGTDIYKITFDLDPKKIGVRLFGTKR